MSMENKATGDSKLNDSSVIKHQYSGILASDLNG